MVLFNFSETRACSLPLYCVWHTKGYSGMRRILRKMRAIVLQSCEWCRWAGQYQDDWLVQESVGVNESLVNVKPQGGGALLGVTRSISISLSVCGCRYIDCYIYICMYIYIYIHIYIHIYIYVYIYMCVYIHIYMYIHIYRHTYIYNTCISG